MRNPFARLATRDAARPSLRDRAVALKASAARVIRRDPAAATDPVFDAIAESRRLTIARAVANDLPIPAGDLGPLPEQDAAMQAQFTHIDNVLLKALKDEKGFAPNFHCPRGISGERAAALKAQTTRLFAELDEHRDAIERHVKGRA